MYKMFQTTGKIVLTHLLIISSFVELCKKLESVRCCVVSPVVVNCKEVQCTRIKKSSCILYVSKEYTKNQLLAREILDFSFMYGSKNNLS